MSRAFITTASRNATIYFHHFDDKRSNATSFVIRLGSLLLLLLGTRAEPSRAESEREKELRL